MSEQTIPAWHEKKKSAVKLGNAVQKTIEDLMNLPTEVPDPIAQRIMDIQMEKILQLNVLFITYNIVLKRMRK